MLNLRSASKWLVALILFSLVFPGLAAAQNVPQTMTHQGRLLDASGEPLSGTTELIYTLYNAPTAGDILWQQTLQVEVDDQGFYSVKIGGGPVPLVPLLRTSEERYIGIIVDGGAELRPRVALTSVPYAWIAKEAEVARSVTDGSVHSEALADDFSLDPQIALGGLSCSSGDLARFDGQSWYCETTENFAIQGDLSATGQVQAESFNARTNFDQDRPASEYPQGVSWQLGRGADAPAEDICRYGIVQTMNFSSCRLRQVCFARNGAIFARYLQEHCNLDGPWEDWIAASP